MYYLNLAHNMLCVATYVNNGVYTTDMYVTCETTYNHLGAVNCVITDVYCVLNFYPGILCVHVVYVMRTFRKLLHQYLRT